MKQNTSDRLLKLLSAIAICIAFFEFLYILYVNFFLMDVKLGMDASSIIMYANEMVKQKTIYIENVGWQNNFPMFAPIVALVTVFTKDIFISQGLTNVAATIFMIMFLSITLDNMKVQKLVKWLIFSLFLNPYQAVAYYSTANDLGYFSMMFVSSAAYAPIACYFLSNLAVVTCLEKHDTPTRGMKLIISISASLLFSFGMGVATRFAGIAIFILPYALYISTRIFITMDLKFLKKEVFFYIASSICLMLMGSIIGGEFVSKESYVNSISIPDFSKSISSLFGSYRNLLSLIGAIPSVGKRIAILSFDGLWYTSNHLLFLFLISSLCYFVFMTCRKGLKCIEFDNIGLIIFLITISLFLQLTGFLAFSELDGLSRYLIPTFILFLLIFSNMMENIEPLRRFLLFIPVLCMLIISLAGSMFNYEKSIEYGGGGIALCNYLKSDRFSGVRVVYGFTHIEYIHNLMVLDDSKIYRYCNYDSANDSITLNKWGEYTYFDELGSYAGPTVILAHPNGYKELPDRITDNYEYLDTVGYYDVYYGAKNYVN